LLIKAKNEPQIKPDDIEAEPYKNETNQGARHKLSSLLRRIICVRKKDPEMPQN